MIDGAITYLSGSNFSYEKATLIALCERYSIDTNKRFIELSDKEINNLFYREDEMLQVIAWQLINFFAMLQKLQKEYMRNM